MTLPTFNVSDVSAKHVLVWAPEMQATVCDLTTKLIEFWSDFCSTRFFGCWHSTLIAFTAFSSFDLLCLAQVCGFASRIFAVWIMAQEGIAIARRVEKCCSINKLQVGVVPNGSHKWLRTSDYWVLWEDELYAVHSKNFLPWLHWCKWLHWLHKLLQRCLPLFDLFDETSKLICFWRCYWWLI